MSVPIYNWQCTRCGECCIQTVNKIPFGKAGVWLMPEERKLFPQPIVKPLYGLGVKGNARPRPQVTYAYQMIGTPCPHWNGTEKTCRIYEYRPLICRMYPLSSSISGIIMHRECPALDKLVPINVTLMPNQLKNIDTELKAIKSMNTYMGLIFAFNMYRVNLSYFWFYHFDKHSWELLTEEQLQKALGDLRKRIRKNTK